MYKMTTTRRDVGYDGLRREPQMEEIVNYLANHQERMRFPDRQAKQIRNHPFMTQLDFFDTNEEQKRAWEVQQRKQEAKEIATQAGTSEAMEGTKKTKTRADTGIMRPDNLTRAGATEQYDDDVKQMRLNPSKYKEHAAESKTLRHERGNKSDSMAQSVRFSLRNRVAHPDAPEVPVYPGYIKPKPGVPVPTNIPTAVGERIPTPIVIGTKVGMKVPIRVKEEEEVYYDIFAQDEEGVREDTRVGLEEAEDVDIPDEVRGNLEVKQREKEMKKQGMLMFALKQMKMFAWDSVTPDEEENARELQKTADYLSDIKAGQEASIQSYLDAQASGERIGLIDSMLNIIGGGKAAEDPNSNSSSAVRSKGKAAAPKNTATPEKPFANKVGEVVKEKGKPFTGPQGKIFKGGLDAMRVANLLGAQ